jgi:hypothetical protein
VSVRCVTWALEKAPVQDPTQVLLLIALADRANEDGMSAWPSQEWLAQRARCSTRTVRRHLVELEHAGVIRRGDQRSVAHLRVDKRPVVWDLAVEVESDNAAGQRQDRLSGRSEWPGGQNVRADTPGTSGRTAVSYKPSLEPSLVLTHASEPSRVTASRFDEWWSVYPRKAGKGAARKSYERASRLVGHQVLLDAAARFRADPNRTDDFTPHPATWLNQDRWEDDPLPSPSGRSGAPATAPAASEDWLRSQWQAGNVKAVEDRSGLRYAPGRLPDEITTADGVREWNLAHRRKWIETIHDQVLAAISEKGAA